MQPVIVFMSSYLNRKRFLFKSSIILKQAEAQIKKTIFAPVLLAISTKGCTLLTPVVPLCFTPNLVNEDMEEKQNSPVLDLFGGILLDADVEIVSRIRVAWVLRKVQLIHLMSNVREARQKRSLFTQGGLFSIYQVLKSLGNGLCILTNHKISHLQGQSNLFRAPPDAQF